MKPCILPWINFGTNTFGKPRVCGYSSKTSDKWDFNSKYFKDLHLKPPKIPSKPKQPHVKPRVKPHVKPRFKTPDKIPKKPDTDPIKFFL